MVVSDPKCTQEVDIRVGAVQTPFPMYYIPTADLTTSGLRCIDMESCINENNEH
jgi:hypothetical protein